MLRSYRTSAPGHRAPAASPSTASASPARPAAGTWRSQPWSDLPEDGREVVLHGPPGTVQVSVTGVVDLPVTCRAPELLDQLDEREQAAHARVAEGEEPAGGVRREASADPERAVLHERAAL